MTLLHLQIDTYVQFTELRPKSTACQIMTHSDSEILFKQVFFYDTEGLSVDSTHTDTDSVLVVRHRPPSPSKNVQKSDKAVA